MKFLLLATFVATICYVSAGKRLILAMNGGMLPGVNGGQVNGVNPGMMAGGLNPLVVAGGGAGVIGQPQFAQFVPVFAVPAPVPNVYPIPAVNTLPFMGAPQMAPVNPPQQPLMVFPGGAVPQQLPLQADPLRRFRRENVKSENTLKATVDTQIPAPSVSTTEAPCGNDYEDN